SVIAAHATASATDAPDNEVPVPAVAVAAAFGGVQVIANASTAFQSATNGKHGSINAVANAHASGTSDAFALAVAGGVNQVALAVGQSTQIIDNQGSINAAANAVAFAGDSASANAIALGAVQLAIASRAATANLHNDSGAVIAASAHATAGSFFDPADDAVANAAALGVNHAIFAGSAAGALLTTPG